MADRPEVWGSLLGAMAAFSRLAAPPREETAFAKLSPEAQDLVVRATLGEFDKSGPPEIAEEVRKEIAGWAAGGG